jgi:hypothetical protein
MEIANALHVEPTTARSLVQRAIARAREKVAEKQKLLVDAVDVDELTRGSDGVGRRAQVWEAEI